VSTPLATSALTLSLTADRGAVAPRRRRRIRPRGRKRRARRSPSPGSSSPTTRCPARFRYVPGNDVHRLRRRSRSCHRRGRPHADIPDGRSRPRGGGHDPLRREGRFRRRSRGRSSIAPLPPPWHLRPFRWRRLRFGGRGASSPVRSGKRRSSWAACTSDDDRDGTIDPGEPGVSRVIVLLEDGPRSPCRTSRATSTWTACGRDSTSRGSIRERFLHRWRPRPRRRMGRECGQPLRRNPRLGDRGRRFPARPVGHARGAG
jgi:hypothetical protein